MLTLIDIPDNAPHVLKSFVTQATCLPLSHRRIIRTVQEYFGEAGTLHLSIALQCFILNTQLVGWTTRCHTHSIYEHKAGVNDVDNYGREDQPQVTGVPFQRQNESVVPTYLGKLLPKAKGSAAPTKWSDPEFVYPNRLGPPPRLGIMELLQFYILDPETQIYTLHCGCELEEVLLDFFLWKQCRSMASLNTDAVEYLGNPVEPRTRQYYHHIFADLGTHVLDLYQYNLLGYKREEGNVMKDHVRGSFRESILHSLRCRLCGQLECRSHGYGNNATTASTLSDLNKRRKLEDKIRRLTTRLEAMSDGQVAKFAALNADSDEDSSSDKSDSEESEDGVNEEVMPGKKRRPASDVEEEAGSGKRARRDDSDI